MSEACPIVRMTVTKQSEQVEMSVSGNAGGTGVTVADRLRTAREIRLSGDAQGGALFDGSKDAVLFTAVEKLTNEELEAMLK